MAADGEDRRVDDEEVDNKEANDEEVEDNAAGENIVDKDGVENKIDDEDDDDDDEEGEEEEEEVRNRHVDDEEVDDEEEVQNKKVDDDEVDTEEDDDEDDDDEKVHNRKVDDEEVDDEEEVHNRKVDDEDVDDDEEEEEEDRPQPRNDTIYDFDIMMAKKKEENSRKRKRRNYDIINDNDDIIADIINQMKDAVEADSEANRNKTVATKKLKLLPFVISQLRKVDLRDAFLDSDVLSVITEWLAPLPDKSLPHLNIRESLLKILIDFNLYDVDRIKSSGIGKAIMYLYKHPKETKENKQRAKQLISCWSRPIFQLDSSFTAISREEREQRDLELRNKQGRLMKQQHDSSDVEGPGPSKLPRKDKEDAHRAQKPGDKGWIPRARVPAPSMKDYVIRPHSKVDGDIGKNSKRPANMLEKYMKNQQERRRAGRQQRAINMKIDRV